MWVKPGVTVSIDAPADVRAAVRAFIEPRLRMDLGAGRGKEAE